MLKTVKARRAVKKPHIKKDDTVVILWGDDSGKKGRVLEVNPTKGTCVVEGVNIVKRHQKPTKKIGKGGIISREHSLPLSKVALFCAKCNDTTGASFVRHDKEIARVCDNCKEPIGRK